MDNKYFYNETEDSIIVNSINADFLHRQEERKTFERIWELNLNFYLGNQYSYITSKGDVGDVEKNYYWENREVYNHIAPIIESRLSKLNKVNPSVTIKPSTNSENDKYSAKLSQAILNSNFNDNNLKALITTATYWSEITGTSFYKVSWNSELGDFVGDIAGKKIKNGDVQISVCSPFEIYPDSNWSEEIDDCASIIEARAMPADEVSRIWDREFSGEEIDLYELNNHAFLSNISGRSNLTKVTHEAKHDYLMVLERYEKPSSKHENGRLTIICQNKLLYDGDLPYIIGKRGNRTYPFIKQVSGKQVACFWGISVIDRCIPLQRAYNSIKNKKHEFISRIASGVLTVEDGSVDIDNLESEGLAPGKILVYRSGSTAPTFLNPGTIPADFEKEEESLLAEINKLACISEVTTNTNVPSGVNSGNAISLLIEQDENRLSIIAENIRNAIKLVGLYVLKLYKQFATEIRLNKLLDESGNLELFYWNKNDITKDDIELDADNELGDTSNLKKELILSIIDKGILNDEDGKISNKNKEKILTMLGFKNWNTYNELNELHKIKANSENMNLEKIEDPLDVDDHKIHIDEHIKFLISNTNCKLSKEKIDVLVDHINKHKYKLNEE